MIYKVKPGTQTNTRVRLRGKGVPTLRNKDLRGDHYVTLLVQTPESLTAEQRRILEEFDATLDTRWSAKADKAAGSEKKSKKKKFTEKLNEIFD